MALWWTWSDADAGHAQGQEWKAAPTRTLRGPQGSDARAHNRDGDRGRRRAGTPDGVRHHAGGAAVSSLRASADGGSPQEPARVILGIVAVGRLGRPPSAGTEDEGRGGQDDNERIHLGTLPPAP